MTAPEMTTLSLMQARFELDKNHTNSIQYERSCWTAEDFERYGEELVKKAESKKAAESPKKEETIKPVTFNICHIEETRAKVAANEKARVEKEGQRVRSKYGEQLTDAEVIKVLNVENEMSYCKGCTANCCGKTYNAYTYKVAFYDEISKSLRINSFKCPRYFQKKYRLTNIPKAYIDKTFNDYQVDANNVDAAKAAKKLIEMNNIGAYFYGGVGTGKTLLAAIIAQEKIKRGREVIFATVPTISARIRSTFNSNGKEKIKEEDILEKLYTVPTLILDDMGLEKPTRFVCSTLCNVFNERYNAQLQTILTSNYPLEALAQIFNNPADSKEPTLDGSRIYDRCKQMCAPFELKGKSRRG